jgi:hypothetical protein
MPYDDWTPSSPTLFRGAGDNLEIDNSAQVEAQRKAQEAYTAQNMMSREDFLKKYGETFVADDKGGNAASEVAGQSVADYYDQFLDPNRKVSTGAYTGGGDNFNFDPSASVPNASWGNGYKYRDAMPYFDAWDNVDPHPESQDLGGVGEFWRQIGRPAASAAAMYFGVNALGGALGSAGAAGSTAGGGSLGAAADFGAGTYAAGAPAAELATTAGAIGGPGSAGWGMDLGTEALASSAGSGMTAAQEAEMVASLNGAGHTGASPSLWSQAKNLVKDMPLKKAVGVLQMLGSAGGQQQATGQASPLASYVPQGGPQPYDWQKIQNAANRAGVSMSEYVSQNQRYLNAGVYP